jgi:hypothetical protein
LADNLPKVPTLDTIKTRLPLIFPEGTDQREYLIREMCAKVVFVMFYVAAIENTGRRIRPNQVTRMTDEQSRKTSSDERLRWAEQSYKPRKKGDTHSVNGWYASDSREGIRDESLKDGLIMVGAAVDERSDLTTTSSLQRYALRRPFAALFDDALSGQELELAIAKWQEEHLSSQAFARLMLTSRSAKNKSKDVVAVQFPDGQVKNMAPGESSIISKAVIEVFSKLFLENAAHVHLSESKTKIIKQDEALAKRIKLDIDVTRVLPDIILADLGPKIPLLVFVECVASDGPISQARKEQLQAYASKTGLQAAFVTAFLDRGHKGYAKVYKKLAWGSFAWFVSEPENLLCMKEGVPLTGKRLFDLIE